MAEKLSLRDRRRLETALEIRRVTLTLCLRHGFEAVTTEMISLEAGISPRTFFNYFANKEVALVGPLEEMRRETLDWFCHGTGSVIEDFLRLFAQHLDEHPPEREFMRDLLALRDTTPQLQLVFLRSMTTIHEQVSEALQLRLGPGNRALADLMAATLMTCVSKAMEHWAAEGTGPAHDLIADARRLLSGLGAQLLQMDPA